MVALKSGEIEAFIARPDPQRAVVLVFGPDAGLVRERVAALLGASVDDVADPFALVQLAGDDVAADPARLVDEAATIPLFGARRAIWVKAGGKNIAGAVETLLATPLKDCRVVIEAGDLRRNAPLRAVCERARTAAALSCYPDGERELLRLIDDEMRRVRMTITPQARSMLAGLLGGDRQASRSELNKLTLYALGKDSVEVEDVVAVIGDATGLALDAAVDAAFAGNAAGLDRHYAKARREGSAPGAILLAALRHASQLHVFKLAVRDGAAVSAAVERSAFAKNFRRRPLVEQALNAWTLERLRDAIALLAAAVRDSRIQNPLADSIAGRALLSIARLAASKG